MNIKLYQIYYSEETRQHIKPGVIPYDNTWYEGKPLCRSLESNCIIKIFEDIDLSNTDFLGILSWKFNMKIPVKIDCSPMSVQDRMAKDGYQHSVYSFFSPQYHKPNMWKVAEKWHKGIIEMAEEIFRRIGQPLNLNELPFMPTIYQNHHITEAGIYQDYVETLLKPFVECMEDSEDLQPVLNQRNSYKTNVKTIDLMRSMGQPHYTMHPFIAERLFSTYLCLRPHIKVKHFC